MFRNKLSNITLWLVFICACLVNIPFILYWDRDQIFELKNAIVFSSFAGLMVGHFPGFWRAVRAPFRTLRAAELLNVGLFLQAVGGQVVFGARWLWRIADRPWWATDHWVVASGLWLFMFGTILMFLTVGSQEGRVTPSSYQRGALILFLAALISTMMVTFFGK